MRPIQKVEVIANVASGSVDDDAPEQLAKIFADHGVAANVCAPETHELTDCLRRAVDAGPDLLVVLAGDGTARAAAELCGPDGPMIAPLPGGTMNMLPHAIYGVRPWQDALSIALAQGEERPIGGGEVEGHRFMVAAILGSPALWAPAREAARFGRRRLAWTRARRALRQAFTGRLRYALDAGPREKAEALIFMCPTTSRALADEEQVLEAAALDVSGVADVVRLGVNTLVRDWRDDPAVASRRCRLARIWSSQGIPAVLDGESVRLKASTEVRYTPTVARVLTIPKDV
ncbi:NAD(+)/NADH kinase [Phenylobacterium sp. J426]|uniref:diacylglycerol/lipid kinase family protein n=1 Tax=Phenylobacterium sp. J426 TaxID=2898439 RepID=UPI00215101D0|nr:diacylglycerol kinase family protein [Phenylobacterium sp. J426]MCR5873535.1 NAD(+)/NADH kinase [Phenylobacterium sp. J426]